ncbi:excinuclease ATPase subunit [Diaphorobacter aerolatus]|uniref:Excinuclease ATPase subunit n=1 Tax=Diaphorobacter aerolatus TaxID=1288495 RepID=A0A7H0GM04_9BURK|nr:excinuclease ATPase subunit [Diaphorobacter aerolatus]QNP49320.1 excinuclease ATPase subunit [Diaphorobacter aerolatus]
MILKKTAIVALLALGTVTAVHARDDALMVPIEDAIQMGMADGKLDGSVKFYMSGANTPAVSAKLGEDISNKKTSGVGKDDPTACKWAALSALMAFQESAKQKGANAVIDLHSFYKRNAVKDPVNFECHAGNIMAGVALKGTYAKTK